MSFHGSQEVYLQIEHHLFHSWQKAENSSWCRIAVEKRQSGLHWCKLYTSTPKCCCWSWKTKTRQGL